MKKLIAMLAVFCMTLSLCACGGAQGGTAAPAGDNASGAAASGSGSGSGKTVKAGFIFLHDEQSTYDLNFMNAAKEACKNMGIEYVFKDNIPEGQECYEAAMDLVDEGCNMIFGDSFGHEDYLIQAASECPDVQFSHATGTKAHTEGLSNFHNAFASIYQGRYLAGIAAGLKLNEMIDSGKITADQAKMGYVGAYTYAEVISGYTAFFLGARSVCPSVTMEVTFTGSWYDMALETEGAQKLIDNGCVLISQHADSMGAPSACESAGVPNVSYNGSTYDAAPNTFIVSSRINWTPYFEYMIECIQNGKTIDTDWVGTIATSSVLLTDFNDKVAAKGTEEAVNKAISALKDGSLHVFDTSTFKVDGKALDSYKADVDTDPAYEPDTEAISDGYFHESEYRSAPYFDIQIDGIELLDTAF